jgi:hypothetical protein
MSRLTIYGHSLGATFTSSPVGSLQGRTDVAPAVHGPELENVFASVLDMLRVLYTQRWLPLPLPRPVRNLRAP